MSCTRRVRRGGAGFLNTIGEAIGIKKKSPFTAGPSVTNNERNILKKIKQLEEGIPAVKSLGNFEGFNTTQAIQAMEQELSTLKKKVANLRGENTMTFVTNPGYAPKGGKRKSRKIKKTRRVRPMKGRGLPTDYSDCSHLYEETHDEPSLLIEIEKPKRIILGPARPWRWYDCKEVKDQNNNLIGYKGKSCQNKRYDGLLVRLEDVTKTGEAWYLDELEAWCCPRDEKNY